MIQINRTEETTTRFNWIKHVYCKHLICMHHIVYLLCTCRIHNISFICHKAADTKHEYKHISSIKYEHTTTERLT